MRTFRGKKEEGNCYVEKVYFLSNVEKSRNHFSMIPREQFQAAKDMRRDGHELLGNFHSHPCGKPWPSREDKRLACDTNLIYFIISLMERENPQLKAYTYDQKKMQSVRSLRLLNKERIKGDALLFFWNRNVIPEICLHFL